MPFLAMPEADAPSARSENDSATPQGTASTLKTACALDCPDACSLEVTVEDGRVTKIEGDRRNPLTSGFICSKVRRMARHLEDESRILHPAIRRGAKGEADFEPVSWDEALDHIAQRLGQVIDRRGGEAILPLSYGGSNGFLTQDSTDARFFRRLGASRLDQAVCAAATTRAAVGLYGKFPGIAPEDFAHAKLIIVWGANPSDSGIHLVPVIQEAQRNGAKLVVIDPRRIPLAKKADLHLGLRPGTDLPVALAMIRWLFTHDAADIDFLSRHATGVGDLRLRAEPWTLEKAAEVAGIDAADLEWLARTYAETSPAAIRCGWGQERNRNGGSASAAIFALPAVGGKFGVRGGGYMMSNGPWRLDAEALDGEPEAETRIVNMNRVGRALLDREQPIDGLFVYNCNPLMTLPEQAKVRRGLERGDLFTVVFDAVLTDTARYADVLLPATTFLEHRDLAAGYGSMVLQEVRPVVSPPGEARPNFEVFAELCRRMGIDRADDVTDPAALQRALLENAFNGESEAILSQLAEQGFAAHPNGGLNPVQFVDNLPWTEDQRIHLVPEALDREAPLGLYGYRDLPVDEAFPLTLLSPATRRTISSTFGQLHRKRVAVALFPTDAEERGLAEGETVRVWNTLGEVICPITLDPDLRPGVAMLPKGLWGHNTDNGNTSNALVPDAYTDLGEGAVFNDARVQVARLEG